MLISKTARQLRAWVGDAQRKAEAAARSRRGLVAETAGNGPFEETCNGGGEHRGGGAKSVLVPEGRHTHLASALRNAGTLMRWIARRVRGRQRGLVCILIVISSDDAPSCPLHRGRQGAGGRSQPRARDGDQHGSLPAAALCLASALSNGCRGVAASSSVCVYCQRFWLPRAGLASRGSFRNTRF